jgi:hypothetical protein
MLARAERWEGIMEWVVDACKKKYTIPAQQVGKGKSENCFRFRITCIASVNLRFAHTIAILVGSLDGMHLYI